MASQSAIRPYAVRDKTWQAWLAAWACFFLLHPISVRAETTSPETFLALAEAHEKSGQFYDALGDYTRAADLDPVNRAAIRGMVLMSDHIGAAQAALEHMEQHKDMFNAEERRRIEGDAAAMQVRQGVLEPVGEAERYAATDRALARLDELIARWSQEGFAARNDVRRARLDRLVALRNRMRMQDVADEYGKISDIGIEIPVYALSAAGDAYLYLRQPEIARELYRKALETQPGNFDMESQLFFADMECDDYDEAYALIDRLQREQPLWISLRGSAVPLPNPNRQNAELFAADARMDGEEFDEAAQRLETIVHHAPFDARNQYALGNLYLLRELPRHARTAYETGKAIANGHDSDNETGIALADLELQNFQVNAAEINDLVRRFPERLPVQNAERQLEIHNMAEAQFLASYQSRPTDSTAGGPAYELEAVLYSPPINYNWRLFVDEMFAHGAEPNGEGLVGYWRNAAGIEYRAGNITADIAPTENIYHGTERTGITGNARYTFDDEWSVFGGGALFSRDVPLRALNGGITADEIKLGAEWHENESRDDQLVLAVMPFSDGNTQMHLTNAYRQRLYADPHWIIDGLFNLAASESTADENRPYYNPSADLLGLIGARATQILYHRYETVYQHALTIMPGGYWEQHFGTDDAFDVHYEQRLRMDGVFETGIGIDYLHRPYDGKAEDDIGISLDLTRRF